MLVVLGVTGGIAAYKAAEVLRGLQHGGADVTVMMTTAASRFITPLTMQTLSGRRVAIGALQDPGETGVEHIDVARSADLLVVAPATANSLGKFANGIADDFLSTFFTAVSCPVLVAPAMNLRMYLSPAVQKNLEVLRERGVRFVGPEEGWLACREEGWGRMAAPSEIVEQALDLLRRRDTWKGARILVTAGPTREPIDAARFLSNRSSGRMGYALAEAAARRGADVTLVSGPTGLPTPPGVLRIDVTRAEEMARAVEGRFEASHVVIKAAAVADFRVASPVSGKLKKSSASRTLVLEPNPDILRNLGERKGDRLLVGFAAETEDLEGEARRKLQEKNLDLIVANEIGKEGSGFDSATNEVVMIAREGTIESLPRMTKRRVAERVLDWIEPRLPARSRSS